MIIGALRFVVKLAGQYAHRIGGSTPKDEITQLLISAGNLGLLIAVDKFKVERQTRFLTYAAWWVREKMLEELDSMDVIRVPVYRQKELRAKRQDHVDYATEAPFVSLDTLEDTEAVVTSDAQLECDLVNQYGAQMLQTAFTVLGFSGRDRYILLAYFGARDDPKTLKQLSHRLGLSGERIRQVKLTLLDQLRTYLQSRTVHTTADAFTV